MKDYSVKVRLLRGQAIQRRHCRLLINRSKIGVSVYFPSCSIV